MLSYQLMSLVLSISGLCTIIFLAFTLIFLCEKYPWRKPLILFLVSLAILSLSLVWFSQSGYRIIG